MLRPRRKSGRRNKKVRTHLLTTVRLLFYQACYATAQWFARLLGVFSWDLEANQWYAWEPLEQNNRFKVVRGQEEDEETLLVINFYKILYKRALSAYFSTNWAFPFGFSVAMKGFFGKQQADLLVGASALSTLHARTKQKSVVFLASWTGIHTVGTQGGALLALTLVSFVFPKRDVYVERAVEA